MDNGKLTLEGNGNRKERIKSQGKSSKKFAVAKVMALLALISHIIIAALIAASGSWELISFKGIQSAYDSTMYASLAFDDYKESRSDEYGSGYPVIALDGHVFTVGKFKLSDLLDLGWETLPGEISSLAAHRGDYARISCKSREIDDNRKWFLTVYLSNDCNDAIPISDAVVSGMSLCVYKSDDGSRSSKYPNLILYPGISIGSSIDSVVQAYGEYDDSEIGQSWKTYAYHSESGKSKAFLFNSSGRICEMYIESAYGKDSVHFPTIWEL